jgi:N-acetylmuramoyl-L-alanine amidase
MNFTLRPFLLVALALGAGAAECLGGAARAAEPVRIAGHEYERLADWAKANDFAMSWVRRDETVQLSNAATKLLLQIRVPEAQINGVKVRLLFPLVQQNEGVLISQMDVQSTLRPVIFPPRERPGSRIASICLDPGHGGKDPGFIVGSSQEKRFTLLLAQELRDQLKRAGWKVTLTRATDAKVDLPARPELASRRKADLFLSLHFNAAEVSPGSVQGAEVYCLTPAGAPSSNAGGEGAESERRAGGFAGNRHNDQNLLLAYQLQKALTRGLGVEDRGVHRARFVVLRDATIPAALVEAGFMSHPVEGRKILTAAYRREIAQAIVGGLAAYKRIVERQ